MLMVNTVMKAWQSLVHWINKYRLKGNPKLNKFRQMQSKEVLFFKGCMVLDGSGVLLFDGQLQSLDSAGHDFACIVTLVTECGVAGLHAAACEKCTPRGTQITRQSEGWREVRQVGPVFDPSWMICLCIVGSSKLVAVSISERCPLWMRGSTWIPAPAKSLQPLKWPVCSWNRNHNNPFTTTSDQNHMRRARSIQNCWDGLLVRGSVLGHWLPYQLHHGTWWFQCSKSQFESFRGGRTELHNACGHLGCSSGGLMVMVVLSGTICGTYGCLWWWVVAYGGFKSFWGSFSICNLWPAPTAVFCQRCFGWVTLSPKRLPDALPVLGIKTSCFLCNARRARTFFIMACWGLCQDYSIL